MQIDDELESRFQMHRNSNQMQNNANAFRLAPFRFVRQINRIRVYRLGSVIFNGPRLCV